MRLALARKILLQVRKQCDVSAQESLPEDTVSQTKSGDGFDEVVVSRPSDDHICHIMVGGPTAATVC